MGRKLSLTFAMFFGLLLGLCFSATAQDAKTVLQSATKAMGDVKSIQYSGTGEFGILGQAYTPGGAWPVNDIKSYTRTIDYGSKSAKEEMTLVEPNPIRKGGGGAIRGRAEAGQPGERRICLEPAGQRCAARGRRGRRAPAANLAHSARLPESGHGK